MKTQSAIIRKRNFVHSVYRWSQRHTAEAITDQAMDVSTESVREILSELSQDATE
jgi:hypothetical protein